MLVPVLEPLLSPARSPLLRVVAPTNHERREAGRPCSHSPSRQAVSTPIPATGLSAALTLIKRPSSSPSLPIHHSRRWWVSALNTCALLDAYTPSGCPLQLPLLNPSMSPSTSPLTVSLSMRGLPIDSFVDARMDAALFCLPALTPAEWRSIGVDTECDLHPMCVTVPLGFSRAVYEAQTGHEHLFYSSGALSHEDNIIRMASPVVSCEHAIHGIEIDDFFLFCLNQRLATEQFIVVPCLWSRPARWCAPTTEHLETCHSAFACISLHQQCYIEKRSENLLRFSPKTAVPQSQIVVRPVKKARIAVDSTPLHDT
jgi:hypothetical protein